jgi:hypothetical protein
MKCTEPVPARLPAGETLILMRCAIRSAKGSLSCKMANRCTARLSRMPCPQCCAVVGEHGAFAQMRGRGGNSWGFQFDDLRNTLPLSGEAEVPDRRGEGRRS